MFGIFKIVDEKIAGHLVGLTVLFVCGCVGELRPVRGEYWGFRLGFDTADCTESHQFAYSVQYTPVP